MSYPEALGCKKIAISSVGCLERLSPKSVALGSSLSDFTVFKTNSRDETSPCPPRRPSSLGSEASEHR